MGWLESNLAHKKTECALVWLVTQSNMPQGAEHDATIKVLAHGLLRYTYCGCEYEYMQCSRYMCSWAGSMSLCVVALDVWRGLTRVSVQEAAMPTTMQSSLHPLATRRTPTGHEHNTCSQLSASS